MSFLSPATIALAAGLKPWPKFYNALRSSCEQDWKAGGIAEPTYCAWVGHGAGVSRGHYTSPMESEFSAITLQTARQPHVFSG